MHTFRRLNFFFKWFNEIWNAEKGMLMKRLTFKYITFHRNNQKNANIKYVIFKTYPEPKRNLIMFNCIYLLVGVLSHQFINLLSWHFYSYWIHEENIKYKFYFYPTPFIIIDDVSWAIVWKRQSCMIIKYFGKNNKKI